MPSPDSEITPVMSRPASKATGIPSLDGKSMNAPWSTSPPRPITRPTNGST
jgi:hypothetical protein